jgi:hypothetical protein
MCSLTREEREEDDGGLERGWREDGGGWKQENERKVKEFVLAEGRTERKMPEGWSEVGDQD